MSALSGLQLLLFRWVAREYSAPYSPPPPLVAAADVTRLISPGGHRLSQGQGDGATGGDKLAAAGRGRGKLGHHKQALTDSQVTQEASFT